MNNSFLFGTSSYTLNYLRQDQQVLQIHHRNYRKCVPPLSQQEHLHLKGTCSSQLLTGTPLLPLEKQCVCFNLSMEFFTNWIDHQCVVLVLHHFLRTRSRSKSSVRNQDVYILCPFVMSVFRQYITIMTYH